MVQRIKTVQESDLRMLGSLARSIQRVLPVTQADIDAAAALGQGWVVTRVVEVSDPLDNLRGGTQLVIRQNSILPGQSVQRVLIVSGPGGETVIVRGSEYIALPDAIANSLAYLKAFGGTEQRNLPDGYTQVEYIETTTGTEYIDPQVIGNARWVVTAQTNAVKGSSQSLIASTDSASGGSWYGEFTTSGHWDIKSGGTNIASTTKTTADLTFDGNGASGTIGDTSVSREIAVTQGNWRIFGTVSGIGPYVGKLFSAKVYQNGVLVRDFVPAIAPNTEVGLYDKISGQFFTNAGTGEFTAGGEAVPTPDTPMDIVSNNGVLKARYQSGLPLGYTQVEYLGSDSQAYIDTGISGGANDLEIGGKFRYTKYVMYGAVYGNWTEDTSNVTRLILGIRDDKAYMNNNRLSNTGGNSDVDLIRNTIHTFASQYTAYTIDGITTTVTQTTSGNTNNDNIALFNRSVTNPNTSRDIGLEVYSFYIKKGDTIIRNLIPAKRNSDNVLGMYDTVSQTFFTNVGTGEFTAGNPVNDIEVYADSASKNLYNPTTRTNGYYIGADGVIAQGSGTFCYSALIPVKPNTAYVLSGIAGQSGQRRLHAYNSNGDWISQISFSDTTTGNTYNTTGTTPNNCAYVRISIPMADTNVQLEQGSTATPYVPYWNTTETINAHGKNLYNVATRTEGYYISAGGVPTAEPSSCCSALIPVQPNTYYTYNGEAYGGNKRLHAYDSSGNWIQQINYASVPSSAQYTSFSASGRTPVNCRYVRISGAQADRNVQLEQGSTATTYENYFNGGTATAEMLLKVGDYEDVQEILSGAITRNIGIKVLDGTEDWQLINTPYFSLAKSNITPSTLSGDNFNSICSHFARAQSGAELPTKVCFYWGNSYLNINIDVSGSTTLAQFKQFLADQYANGTPVIVIYPLATPTTESVAGQTMQVQQGDNIVEITQASLDNLELEAKYQAAVSLTIQEVQDANLDPNVQVTIN